MKTTIDIADNTFEQARTLAQEQSLTLRSLVEEGLVMAIEKRSQKKCSAVSPVTFKGDGLSPEFEGASWNQFREAIYDREGK